MIDFNSESFGEVVVLGHILMFDNTPVDMRSPKWLEDIKEEYESQWFPNSFEEGDSDGLVDYFTSILEDLWTDNSWGNNESYYEQAVNSQDENLRAMAALNGVHPEVFSKDNAEWVRKCAIDGLIMLRSLGDTDIDDSWVNALLSDDSKQVRQSVALLGKPEHLDVLVNDPEPVVRKAVAQTTTSKEHLNKLVNDEFIVRLAVVANESFTDFELLIRDDDGDIKRTAIERQSNHERQLALRVDPDKADELLQSMNVEVRKILAMRGIGLDVLVNDDSETVRLAVAYRGYGLKQLSNDKANYVRAVAVAYPAELEMPV